MVSPNAQSAVADVYACMYICIWAFKATFEESVLSHALRGVQLPQQGAPHDISDHRVLYYDRVGDSVLDHYGTDYADASLPSAMPLIQNSNLSRRGLRIADL